MFFQVHNPAVYGERKNPNDLLRPPHQYILGTPIAFSSFMGSCEVH